MADNRQSLAGLPVIYTNNVRLAVALTEFRLFIGETLPGGEPRPVGDFRPATETENVDRLCLVVSPDVVPQLIEGLTRAIQGYEATFGPLRKPTTTPIQIPSPPKP